MTDNEIIKALGWLEEIKGVCSSDDSYIYATTIQDIINRQKAEIERLEQRNITNCRNWQTKYISLRAEAVKEFAEKLKEHKIDVDVSFGYGKEVYTEAVAVIEIDNLVKEWWIKQ